MDEKNIKDLINIVGEDFVINELSQKSSYFYDESLSTIRPKAQENSVVVKPKTSQELSKIMKYASNKLIPVVPRGGGTGLCGGAIPTKESIILSLERFKEIYEIDRENMMMTLGAGVTLFDINEELKNHDGITFPIHPGDEGAQVGGMAATNAGGARAVRHGVMRNHIKGLEVVLPDGEILSLGGKLTKDNSGYNLLQLILGSEGSLCIITKVILKIYPEDKYTATVAASFEDIERASKAVLDLLNTGVSPLAVEYQDKRLNIQSAELLGLTWPLKEGDADLMIILSEKSEEALYQSCGIIDEIFDRYQVIESVMAEKDKEQSELLAIRSGSYEVIKKEIAYDFDMGVPVKNTPEFLKRIGELMKEYDTYSNITAHIADGNLHNDIILVEGKVPEYAKELKVKMLKLCFDLGGVISGEHGLGKIEVDYLSLQKSKREIELMKGIKKLFDPLNILNPDTVVKID